MTFLKVKKGRFKLHIYSNLYSWGLNIHVDRGCNGWTSYGAVNISFGLLHVALERDSIDDSHCGEWSPLLGL